MVVNKISEIGKGIKKFVDNKFQAYKEILSNAQNRLILGLLMLGLGCGLIASAYLHVPY